MLSLPGLLAILLLLCCRPRRDLAPRIRERRRRRLRPGRRRRHGNAERRYEFSRPARAFAMRLEREATSDINMLPDTPEALARQWRSFDRDGSALGALINVGWLALAACFAVSAEKAAAGG